MAACPGIDAVNLQRPHGIRPAEPCDAPRLRSIAEAAYAPYVARIGRRPAPMDADFDGPIARAEAWIAETRDGEATGYVIAFPKEDILFIENVAVAPEAQGTGVGRALLTFVEAEARRLGLAAIALYTNAKMTENLALYPRAGYVETDRRVEHGFYRVYFRKELTGP